MVKVSKATAATLPLPALRSCRATRPPPVIRCLITSLSGPTLFGKEAPTHPGKEADLIGCGGVMHHPLPGAGKSLLWGGHSRPRLYSVGGRSLLVFLLLTWVPPGAGVHPPALHQPVIPVCCGDTLPPDLSLGCPTGGRAS